MMKLKKTVFTLLIFSLIFPNLVQAFDLKAITIGVSSYENLDLEASKIDSSDSLGIFDLEKDIPEEIRDLDILTKDEIIEQGQENIKPYLASSWDQGFLSDSKNETATTIMKSNFNADLFTGAAQYSYPFELPAGRGSFGPEISMNYNHQLENYNDYMPLGWSLSGLMYIERSAANGVDSIYTDNQFIFSGGGLLESYALTDAVHGEYRLRVDGGMALRFFYKSDSSWEMIDKNGVHYYFGNHLAAKEGRDLYNKISRWNIEKMEDKNENNIRYEYEKEEGISYLKNIFYTNWQNEDGIYQIAFNYNDRNKNNYVYNKGFEQNYKSLLFEIDIKVKGITRKTYLLETLDQDSVLLLTIRKSFYDEDGSPAGNDKTTDFKYNYNTESNWQEENWGPVDFSFLYPGDTQLIDINNDGFSDVLSSRQILYNNGNVEEEKQTWLNNKGHQVLGNYPAWEAVFPFYSFYENGYSFFTDLKYIDFNGDSYLDVAKEGDVFIADYDENTNQLSYNYNSAYSWWPHWYYINNNAIERASTVDINADGILDYVFNANGKVYLNKWSENNNNIVANWGNLPTYVLDSSGKQRGVEFLDLNKDGLTDILQSFNDQLLGSNWIEAFINQGDGTWAASNNSDYYSPLFFASRLPDGTIIDHKTFLLDIDNDGFEDLIDASTGGVHLYENKGWEFNASGDYQLPQILFNNDHWEDFRWGEADGQPAMDLWFLEEQGGLDHLIIYKNKNNYNNLLKEIKNENGASISLEYTSSALENDNKGPNQTLLKRVSIDDGFGQKQLEEYEYEGGEYFIDDIWQKGRNGYAKVRKKAFDGHSEEYYFHQGNGVENNVEYIDTKDYRGNLYWQKILDENNNILEERYLHWEKINASFNFLLLADEATAFVDGTNRKYKTSSYDYDNWGNLIQINEYKETSVPYLDWRFVDSSGEDNLYIFYEYAIDRNGDIKNSIKHLTVKDGYNKVLKEEKYYYDNLDYGAVSKGLINRQDILKNTSEWISKYSEYNKYGLLIRESDFKNNYSSYAYDENNLFLSEIVNPLNFKKSYETDYYCQQISKETDQNEITLIKRFDEQCRLLEFERVNKKTGAAQFLEKIIYDDSFPSKKREWRYLNEQGQLQDIISYYDGFGRKILQLNVLMNGNWQAVQYKYDQNGNLLSRSDFFEVNSEKWAPYNPIKRTDLKYDALGRVNQFSSNGSFVTVDYGILEKEVRVNGVPRKFKFDMEGNVEEVSVRDAAVFKSSYYDYDALGRLIKYTDAAGNLRNWEYDNLDNLIYNEDIHAAGDSSFISWTYKWDENSNLLSKNILPAGVSLSYQYDKLGRLLVEDDSSTAFIDYNYLYDRGENALGLLTGVKSQEYAKAYSYDDFSNILQENYLIKGKSYNYNYFYNYLGHPVTVIYPDKSRLHYEYNHNGQLFRYWYFDPEGNREDILLNRKYNLWGAVSEENWGNGTKREYKYYDNKNLERELITDAEGEILWLQDYQYDNKQNLSVFMLDSVFLDDVYYYAFDHDDLDRINSYELYQSNNLVDSNNYQYDEINNLLSDDYYDWQYQSNNNSYNNPYATVLGISQNSNYKNISFQYDKQGNVLSDGDNDYTWNAQNQLLIKKSALGQINYLYDEDGQRIYREDKDSWEVYAGAYNEKSDGKVNLYYNDFQISHDSKGETNKYYNYYDKFSNLVLQLDQEANLENYYIYKPFGEIYLAANADTANSNLYHKQEREEGLDYVNGRYYDYEAKRWLSLDPAFENFPLLDISELNNLMANPYLINPYAYLGNSPWRYQDDDGEVLETVLDLISLGISYYDFITDPSFQNGLWFLFDVGATLIPFVPASTTGKIADMLVSRAISGGRKMNRILREVSQNIGKSIKSTMRLIKTVSNEIALKPWVSRLKQWSPGEIGSRLMNLAVHFVKHVRGLEKYNINNIDDYFSFATSFLNKLDNSSVMTHLGIFYKLSDRGKELFYNPFKRLLIVVGKNAEGKFISSFYEVTSQSKLNNLWSMLKNLLGMFWQKLFAFFKFSF